MPLTPESIAEITNKAFSAVAGIKQKIKFFIPESNVNNTQSFNYSRDTRTVIVNNSIVEIDAIVIKHELKNVTSTSTGIPPIRIKLLIEAAELVKAGVTEKPSVLWKVEIDGKKYSIGNPKDSSPYKSPPTEPIYIIEVSGYEQ